LLPPVAATSCGALANQGPQEPIEAKEHNRKTNNAKEEKIRKNSKCIQNSTFRDLIWLAHATSSSVTSKS
jgi:hypothetical protein